jgi:WD40 repeat protein
MFRCLFVLSAVSLLAPSACAGAEPITLTPKSTFIKGWIGGVAFSPDGKYLAIGDSSGSVMLWHVGRKEYRFSLAAHNGPVSALTFTPDGRRLISGGHDHLAGDHALWVPGKASGESESCHGHRGAVHSVFVTADGTSLLTGSIDGTIRLWDLKSHRQSHILKAHTSWVNGLVLSKDGSLLASAGSDNTVRLWETKTWKNFSTLTVKEGEVRSVALSPDGKFVAAGIRYGHVRVWNIETKEEIYSAKAHEGETWAVAFTPDGKTLIAGGGDWNKPSKIRLWDTSNWNERASLKHTGEVLCLAVSRDGKRLAAGGWDRTVKIWDLSSIKKPAP